MLEKQRANFIRLRYVRFAESAGSTGSLIEMDRLITQNQRDCRNAHERFAIRARSSRDASRKAEAANTRTFFIETPFSNERCKWCANERTPWNRNADADSFVIQRPRATASGWPASFASRSVSLFGDTLVGARDASIFGNSAKPTRVRCYDNEYSLREPLLASTCWLARLLVLRDSSTRVASVNEMEHAWDERFGNYIAASIKAQIPEHRKHLDMLYDFSSTSTFLPIRRYTFLFAFSGNKIR